MTHYTREQYEERIDRLRNALEDCVTWLNGEEIIRSCWTRRHPDGGADVRKSIEKAYAILESERAHAIAERARVQDALALPDNAEPDIERARRMV